jgi:hypothetical protein
MKTTTSLKHGALVTALAVLAWLGGPARANAAPDKLDVSLHKIGHPTWKPVDFHLFTAALGTADSGFAEYFDNLQKVLPPPNHLLHPELSLGPGAPHPGPYGRELKQTISHAGFREDTQFRLSEFLEPNGIWFVWMNVPDKGAPSGRSVDSERGPIIPNSLFPMHLEWDVYHDGVKDGETSTYDRPPLPQVNPPFDVEGDSHYPQFLIINESADGSARVKAGHWEHRATLTDATGNGWIIEVRFKVKAR